MLLILLYLFELTCVAHLDARAERRTVIIYPFFLFLLPLFRCAATLGKYLKFAYDTITVTQLVKATLFPSGTASSHATESDAVPYECEK